MHNVCLMAVVDAREHLLHQDGAVTLAELTALQDFVEQLTSLADPTKKSDPLLTKQKDTQDLWQASTYSVTR